MVMESKRVQLLIFFLFAYSLGFLTHWALYKFKEKNFTFNSDRSEQSERSPVNPEDLKNEDLMDALHRDMLERMGKNADDFPGKFKRGEKLEDVPSVESYGIRDFLVQDINRREDDQFVYYEVPLFNEHGEKLEVRVEVKNGAIEIHEKSVGQNHESESSRTFSIEPGLNEKSAQVINDKDKIIIKISKK